MAFIVHEPGVLDYREIGTRLGISHTKVRCLEQRALKKIQIEARKMGMTRTDLHEFLRILSRKVRDMSGGR